MLQKVCKYIDDNKMIEPGDKVLLGISGGADSVCLLFVLLEYQKCIDFSIKAVHVNHMIRGIEADKDAQFVLNLCNENKIDCEVVSVNIPKKAKECGLSLEEAGRLERYKIFDSYGCDKIVVAHHKNDLSETVLFNMVRGSGLKGLCSIKPVAGKIIRPLLCIERTEIEQFLTYNNYEYCIDSTNSDTEYSRNNIRNVVIPSLNQINSKAVMHICELSEIVSEAEDYLEEITSSIYYETVKDNIIYIDKLKNEKELIIKRVIKKAIEITAEHAKDISAIHVYKVISLMNQQSGKSIDLPYNLCAKKEYEKILLYKKDDLCKTDNLIGTIEANIIEPEDKSLYPTVNYTKWIDYAKIKNGLELRNKLPGDYIHIKNGKKKLQDYFTNSKIPAKERSTIPLVADGNEIVWIVGYRINEEYKITDQTDQILEIKYIEGENNGRE